MEFILWDTVGQEKVGDLRQLHYINSDCAIIMFDLTGRETLKSVNKWQHDIRKICPDIPIVLVGNKCDSEEVKIKPDQIKRYCGEKMKYVEISCKTCY